MKLLLERGAEIEARDIDNVTPLYIAALNNNTEITKLLLEHGAEFNMDCRQCITSSHCCTQ